LRKKWVLFLFAVVRELDPKAWAILLSLQAAPSSLLELRGSVLSLSLPPPWLESRGVRMINDLLQLAFRCDVCGIYPLPIVIQLQQSLFLYPGLPMRFPSNTRGPRVSYRSLPVIFFKGRCSFPASLPQAVKVHSAPPSLLRHQRLIFLVDPPLLFSSPIPILCSPFPVSFSCPPNTASSTVFGLSPLHNAPFFPCSVSAMRLSLSSKLVVDLFLLFRGGRFPPAFIFLFTIKN